MTLEVPRQIHEKVLNDEDLPEKFRFSFIFLLKIAIVHFITAVIHESAHMSTCLIFGGGISDIKLVFLGISGSWEHIEGIPGVIIALSGAGSIALLSLFVYRPLYSRSQKIFTKQLCLIGIAQLSQEMFYWTFGSLLGGIPFPWKSFSFMIDPIYLANSLSFGQYVYVFSLIFLPLFLLCKKLNNSYLTNLVSLISVQPIRQSEWKSKFVLHTTKIYILIFQLLNIVSFVFL